MCRNIWTQLKQYNPERVIDRWNELISNENEWASSLEQFDLNRLNALFSYVSTVSIYYMFK